MKLNYQSECYSENINQSDIILWCPKNDCHESFDNYNKISYLHSNKKCYNLETTFKKKVKFSQ